MSNITSVVLTVTQIFCCFVLQDPYNDVTNKAYDDNEI